MFFRNSFWHIILLVKPVYLLSQREPISKNLRYFAWIFIIIIITSHPSEHQESCILVTVKGARLNYTSFLPSHRLWNRIAWFTFFCILENQMKVLFQFHKHSRCQISTNSLLFITVGMREPLGREHVVLACTWESAVGICVYHPLKHLAVPPGRPDETI